jgi:hypothetical protein
MNSKWTVEELGNVNVAKMVKWIKAIPFEKWPQQRPLDDGQLRPSMVTDLVWHDFHDLALPVVMDVRKHIKDSPIEAYQWMLSVVMPGHSIEPHKDQQPDYWKYRVHVPLLTNSKAVTIMEDGEYNMKVGKAYAVNVRKTHAIENRGRTPRIHFMFDVR